MCVCVCERERVGRFHIQDWCRGTFKTVKEFKKKTFFVSYSENFSKKLTSLDSKNTKLYIKKYGQICQQSTLGAPKVWSLLTGGRCSETVSTQNIIDFV